MSAEQGRQQGPHEGAAVRESFDWHRHTRGLLLAVATKDWRVAEHHVLKLLSEIRYRRDSGDYQ